MRVTTLFALPILLAALLGANAARPQGASLEDDLSAFVASNGSLRLPVDDVRRRLEHLGSWFVPDGEAAGFHHVYTQPAARRAYRETGSFPPGTVLVKEIVGHHRGDYTTGASVALATETLQWFLMVKPGAKAFDDHPLWGHGWGWALFEGPDAKRQVATDYQKDCLGCHAPAHASDWVYVEGYPRLRD